MSFISNQDKRERWEDLWISKDLKDILFTQNMTPIQVSNK